MFQSITYVRSTADKFIYQLIDNDFTCEVAVALGGRAGAVAAEYKKRNLPVAKNIALYYLSLQQRVYNINNRIDQDCKWLDKYYPELEYGKLYYSQIINQLHIIMMLS